LLDECIYNVGSIIKSKEELLCHSKG
jgi:hypothetical protein